MSSSVFYKFKSQKEPSRVEFDGTGISVFELKRDIIIKSGLGDGTDFDLAIFNEDGKEGMDPLIRFTRIITDQTEYDDDTAIIPRSTTVIARRLPAFKKGAGRAQRYMTGKMPVTAKNSSRKEQASNSTAKSTKASLEVNDAMTEEQRMEALFAASKEQWSAAQDEMSR
jgi:protein MPE1